MNLIRALAMVGAVALVLQGHWIWAVLLIAFVVL